MLRFQHQRAGLSLMEALVALFIMAIGMISLLTLFPLGAIQMGRALRDDRCAQCAWQADGTVRTWWQVEVVDKAANEASITAPYWASLDSGIVNPTTVTTPSKVVAIDPIGVQSGNTATMGGVERKTCDFLPATKAIGVFLRACSLTDDIFFDETGKADTVSGTSGRVTRQGRYNWMAWIQRPVNSNRTNVNLKVLVFDGRTPGVNHSAAGGDRTVALSGATTVGATQATIPLGLTNAAFPPIAKGGWIIDTGGNGTRMDFYRVQSLTDNGASTTLELDTPWKNAASSIVVLRGLAEVFDRPMLQPTGYLDPKP